MTGEPVCPFCPVRSLSHGVDWYQCLECGRKYLYSNPGVVFEGHTNPQGPLPEKEPDPVVDTVLVASEPGSHPGAIVGAGAEPQRGESVPHDTSGDVTWASPPAGPSGGPDAVTTTETWTEVSP